MSENKPFKLNLGALKNNEKKEEKKLDNKQENKIEENINNIEVKTPYNTKKDSPLDKIIKKELDNSNNIDNQENIKEKEEKNNNISNKFHSLDLSKLKEKKEEKNKIKNEKKQKIEDLEKQKKEIEEKNKIKKIQEDSKEIFSHYESDFKKESETVIQKIIKFKNFIKPKTRTGFVFLLLIITFLGIASLFIINPKIHNIKNYEANILLIKEKIECKIDKNKCKKEEKVKKEEKIKKEITQINNKTLKKEIFVIEYKSKIINGKEIIIYKGKEYSKEKFNEKIKDIIKQKKLEKLKIFLKNSEKK